MRHRIRWWFLPVAALLIVLAGALVWGYTPRGPAPEALAALRSDEQIRVQTRPWLVFEPVAAATDAVGLILYPGGRVDARSYAPVARDIAREGYRVAIVPMPLNLAVLGPERATRVIQAYPSVERWVVGGHSLGGAMAARYAHSHVDGVQGLVLWASYPPASSDLSSSDLAVTSIYATEDGLATADKIATYRELLPPKTRWVPIKGGNHAQFGAYGEQPRDGEASIDAAEQRRRIVQATVALLEQVALATP